MKKIRNILFFSIFSLLGVTISATIFYAAIQKRHYYFNSTYSFNANNYKTINGLNSKVAPNYQNLEFKNALKEDANQKAKSNSTIIYNITWGAIQHKLAFVAHIIEVLNLKPDKNIIIMNELNTVNLDFITNKYPNVQIKLQDGNHSNLDNIDNVIDEIISLNDKNIKVDYYSDDYKFFSSLNEIYNFTQENKTDSYKMTMFNKDKFEKIVPISLVNSINLFADGTGSMNFYDNGYYNQYLKINNQINNGTYNSSLKTKKIADLFIQGKIDESFELFNKDYNPSLFINGLINTNEKGNNNQKQKYFMISTQSVTEINFKNTPALTLNSVEGDHFDPYNTLDSNLISLVKTFSNDMKSDLFSAFGKKLPNIVDFKYMNNHHNYVYSPALMSDESIINSESNSVIKIYNEAIIKNPNHQSNIQIILKGHPRDSNILDKIKNGVKAINPLFDTNIIFEADSSIPYELYLISGIFDQDPLVNKTVGLYQSFSTIGTMMYSENRSDEIFKFYVNDFGKNWLDKNSGPDSRIYPKSKIEYV